MKRKLPAWILIFALPLLMTAGCATSGSGSQKESKTQNKVTSNKNLTLEDYLRRLSYVRVTGQGDNLRISIRSQMSITKTHEQPLFILNGQNMGTNYARVARSVLTGSITSVEAIPASRASLYGMQGSAGVIVIKTK